MTNAIAITTPPNPTVSTAAGPAPVSSDRREHQQQPPKQDQLADLRLVIEEAEDGAGFVYKTLDRRTGEVIQVLPRESVLRLATEGCLPGTIIDQRT